MIKRILRFEKHDWQHVFWLFKSMIKSYFTLDYKGFAEAKFFLKLHLTCDSKLIESEDKQK